MFRIGDIAIYFVPWGLALLALLLGYAAWRAFAARRHLWRIPGLAAAMLAPLLMAATYTGLPIVMTNAQLALLPSWQYFAVLRLGVNAVGDAPAQWFVPSATACSLNAGAGDVGSEVPTVDSGCFNAVLGAATMVQEWGADQTGVTDATTALNSCLAAMTGRTCLAAGGRFYAASAVSIPAATTLKCSDAEPMATNAGWNTIGAILFNTAVSPAIAASGQSAKIQGCAILPHGITFPISSYTGFGTGIVVSDAGNKDFQLIDSVVTGADNAVTVTGNRPYMDHDNFDGTGNTTGVVNWSVANTDSGSFGNIELAQGYFASGSSLCPPGTGIYVGGTPVGASSIFMFGKIVSEGFKTANFNFANSVLADILWSDDSSGTCGYNSSIGIEDTTSGAVFQANNVTIGDANTGLVLANSTLNTIGQLYVESSGADGIDLGNGTQGGSLAVGILQEVSNAGSGIKIIHTGSDFYAKDAIVLSENGSAAPYFKNTSGTNEVLGITTFSIANLRTDLGTANPFDTTYVFGHNSEPMAQNMVPSVACTGIGTGTCVLGGGANVNSGGVVLSPTGSPSATGQVTFTNVAPPANSAHCSITLGNTGSGTWGVAATAVTGGDVVVTWANNSASAAVPLTAGDAYVVNYSCLYQ